MFFIYLCLFFFVSVAVDCFECPVDHYLIQNCSATDLVQLGGIGSRFEYNINVEELLSNWLLCSRSGENLRWSLTMLDSANVPVTNGVFCSPKIALNSSQACMDMNGTAHVHSSTLPNLPSGGFLDFSYLSSALNESISIRYGETGIYPFENQTEIATEGDLAVLEFVIFSETPLFPSVTFNGQPFGSLIPGGRCALVKDASRLNLIVFNPVTTNDSGVYSVNAVGRTYEGNITLNVIPSPSNVTSSSTSFTTSSSPSSISSLPSTSVISTSLSPASSDPFTGTIVWVVVAVGVFFGVVVVLVMVVLVGLCCYVNRKNHSSSSRASPIESELPQMESPARTKKGDTAKSRLGSNSSERPLMGGGSTASVNSRNQNDIATNYTAVYCSREYTQCGTLLKEKHGDLIHLIDNLEDIRLAILQSHCTDILMFADPDDSVFREIVCCGIDPMQPDSRDKLRIIKFVSNDTVPMNTIGVNGFRVVLVDGPPDLMTLLSAIAKAEYPELVKQHRTESVGGRGTSSNGGVAETNELLREIIAMRKDELAVHKENLEVNRERNELMEQQAVVSDVGGVSADEGVVPVVDDTPEFQDSTV